MSPTQEGDSDACEPQTSIELRLYIAGSAPNSVRAMANLEDIGREHLASGYHLEIIDVLDDPLRAIADGVLVTPTLLRIAPGPVRRIIGDLGDRPQVLAALGIAVLK